MDETLGKTAAAPLGGTAKAPAPEGKRKAKRAKDVREYTLGEEIANSVTHGVGAALAIAVPAAKRVFKVLDHSGIYLLIAGTYTPYCLITLEPVGGLWLGLFIWAVALAGVACEAFWTFRPRWVSAVLYVLMGWCIIWFIPQLFDALDPVGFWLLLAGGLSYTVGALFYTLKKVPYLHSVFHAFVLAGSILQFFSVLLFVL